MGCESRMEATGNCTNPEPHICMRTSRPWKLNLPPKGVDLNEDVFTKFVHEYLHDRHSGAPRYHHLNYFIVGGNDGELLPFLRSMRIFYYQNLGGCAGFRSYYRKKKMRMWNNHDTGYYYFLKL